MGLNCPPSAIPGSSCGCCLSPSSHGCNEFCPVSASSPPAPLMPRLAPTGSGSSPPPTGRARGGDARPSRALLAAGTCMEVVQSCRGMQVALGHLCQPQGSLLSVADLSCSPQYSFPTRDPIVNTGGSCSSSTHPPALLGGFCWEHPCGQPWQNPQVPRTPGTRWAGGRVLLQPGGFAPGSKPKEET